ncbi:MAG: SPFH domain-containing protein [Endomicrobia bacterium]|nr:SPFH domain-containing protein [Endomicrobiia bacterium]
MFGLKFVKFEPGLYIFRYKKGKIIAQGECLSFWYYAPSNSFVAIPIGSSDSPFMFRETTADFQEITIQGQMTYRITEPEKTAKMLNYSINSSNLRYISDDPQKLSERLISTVLVATKTAVKTLTLKEAVTSSDTIAQKIYKAVAADNMVKVLGIEILSVAITAIRPNPETAKALEAETREQILRESDEAIFIRRNFAVEQERKIKESELNTEIAVETKNREIQEKKMESEKLVMHKRIEMEETHMQFQISQEEKNKSLVTLKVQNEKMQSDAKAYAVSALMKAYTQLDPEVLKAFANSQMDAGRLIATAFQGISEKAGKIGNLNITPDLLSEIVNLKNKNAK